MTKNSSNILTATLFDVNWWENCSWNCQKMSFFLLRSSNNGTYLSLGFVVLHEAKLKIYWPGTFWRWKSFWTTLWSCNMSQCSQLFNKIVGNSYKKWWKFWKFHEFFRVFPRCVKYRILLSLIFYVKSILENLEDRKLRFGPF